MPPAINEIKFNDLKAKLRELFELDKSDLDFGIYRIMAAKNKDVTEFLDVQLRAVVRDTLAAHGSGAAEQIQAELAKAVEQAEALGADPDTLPKVKELKAKLASAGGASATELEGDIYNHLLAFFSCYYDEGDFISRRRYKGDAYAIPYSGEEVTLHWANKDQYYIKSGEWHQDFRFKVADGKAVRFKLITATVEVNNNKESDAAKRRYILCDANPVAIEGNELILHFEFRTPTDAEKTRVGEGAVAIFGGKYTSTTKGDEREQFCADAEKRALVAITGDWRSAVQKVISDGPGRTVTDTKPLRTILGKQLDVFTAKNTFDYFIHKNLGGFLSRELDFYIKNEVVRLDDLDSLPSDHLQRVQGKVKAVRAVASRIIGFLASVENFQKKLWLKKKLVLNTHWLVTVDRLNTAARDAAAGNPKQWAQWESLGFKPAAEDAILASGPAWGTRAYLDANDKLVVDTGLFPPEFAVSILASDEILAGKLTLDDATTGILINSDNFQALNLLATRYRAQIQYSYIDPPYNTDVSAIPYKNNYQHSAFATMMRDRAALLCDVLSANGVLMVSIDQTERTTVEYALDSAFGAANRVEELIWVQNTNDGRSPTYSTNHEYVEVYAKRLPVVESDARIFREPKPGFAEVAALVRELSPTFPPVQEIKARLAHLFRKRRKRYRRKVEKAGLIWDVEKRNDPWKGIYQYKHAEYRDDNGRFVPEEKAKARKAHIWVYRESDWTIMSSENKQSASTRNPSDPNYRFYEVIHPVSGKPCTMPARGWKGTRYVDPAYPDRNSLESLMRDHRIAFGPTEQKVPSQKRMLHEVATNVAKSVVVDYSDGEKQTTALFGKAGVFLAPKHSSFVANLARQACLSDSTVLDCFGGSGSTGHAVIDLNRLDGGSRRFVLVETNAYFHTLIKPRIAKVLFSVKWKRGQAQDFHGGVSALVKCFALESYDDALNNLPAPAEQLLPGADAATKAAMLQYSLDLQLGPKLLNLDAFADPWNFHIHAQPAGEAEIKLVRVDLVETFNYLIGLKVSNYGPIERYDIEFEKAEHADGLGRLKIKGRLRKGADGPFGFQRVEGELLDGTRVLVVWRKLTGNPEKDAAALDAWMARHREETTQRSIYRDHCQIYINGPITLPQPLGEIRAVLPLEETFKDKMFADTEVSSGGTTNG